MTLDIPQGYGWVLFFLSILGAQLITFGFTVMGPRKKVFTKEFFEKHFPNELKAGEIDLKVGYPDTGSGLYSMKLSHKDWAAVNNAQRTHINFLEVFAPMALFYLISGLVFPRLTVILEIANIIGRICYNTGYIAGGPKGRILGAAINLTVMSVLAITTLTAAYQIGGGIDGLVKLLTGQ